jgi:hypothetical protein
MLLAARCFFLRLARTLAYIPARVLAEGISAGGTLLGGISAAGRLRVSNLRGHNVTSFRHPLLFFPGRIVYKRSQGKAILKTGLV